MNGTAFRLAQYVQPVLSYFEKQLVYSLIVFFCILLLSRLLKKMPPQVHLGLWSLVLLRLLLPPHLASPFSISSILSLWLIPKGISPGSFSDIDLQKAQSLVGDFSVPKWMLHTPGDGNRFILFVLGVLWLTGCLFFLFLFLRKRKQFRNIVSQAEPMNEREWIGIVERWKNRFRIKRPVRLACTNAPISPFTVGVFRPVILLPNNIIQNSQPQLLDAIIGHELAHIKRFDNLQLWLQNILHIVYFFHPVVWLTNASLNFYRECICDLLVLEKGAFSIKSYGQGLIACLKQSQQNYFLTPLPSFSFHHHRMVRRIQNLKRRKKMTWKKHFLTLLFTFLLGAFILPLSLHQQTIVAKEAPDQGNNSAGPVGQSSNGAGTDSRFIRPVAKDQSRLTAPFGPMIDPFTKKERFHRGVDLRADKGTPVVAAADGRVIAAVVEFTQGVGNGRYIDIQHEDGFMTRYTQLDSILVKMDEFVQKGQVIGLVGSSGRSTGPHLHFEIWKNDQPADPADFIQL
jgi:beta-lactamase regulating signal transducer with metallopeptidase domain